MADVPANVSTTSWFESSEFYSASNLEASYSGLFEASGDDDWIAITLIAGMRYVFLLRVDWR